MCVCLEEFDATEVCQELPKKLKALGLTSDASAPLRSHPPLEIKRTGSKEDMVGHLGLD